MVNQYWSSPESYLSLLLLLVFSLSLNFLRHITLSVEKKKVTDLFRWIQILRHQASTVLDPVILQLQGGLQNAPNVISSSTCRSSCDFNSFWCRLWITQLLFQRLTISWLYLIKALLLIIICLTFLYIWARIFQLELEFEDLNLFKGGILTLIHNHPDAVYVMHVTNFYYPYANSCLTIVAWIEFEKHET